MWWKKLWKRLWKFNCAKKVQNNCRHTFDILNCAEVRPFHQVILSIRPRIWSIPRKQAKLHSSSCSYTHRLTWSCWDWSAPTIRMMSWWQQWRSTSSSVSASLAPSVCLRPTSLWLKMRPPSSGCISWSLDWSSILPLSRQTGNTKTTQILLINNRIYITFF